MTASPLRKRVVRFAGRVQGVGFRFTAQQIAQGYAVRGYVKNLDNGQVELVAEGTDQEINRFLNALRDRFEGHIQSELTDDRSPTGQHTGFEIHR